MEFFYHIHCQHDANDGDADTLDVSVDENSIGQFSTRGRSGGGHLWNIILQSGRVGNSVSITEGLHKVKVEVQSTDRYGVEIDQIILEFNTTATECPRSATESDLVTTETVTDGNGVEIDQSETISEFNTIAPERSTSGNDKGPALSRNEIFAFVLIGTMCFFFILGGICITINHFVK